MPGVTAGAIKRPGPPRSSSAQGRRRGPGGRGERGGDTRDRRLRRAPRTGTTPRTRTAAGRRRRRACAWKNAAYAADGLGPGVGEDPDRLGAAEEHREQAPGRCRRCGTPGRGQRVGGQLGHRGCGLVHPGVHLRSAGPQGGQPGRHGQRVTRQRARPGRRGRSGARRDMISARPPNAAAGRPPPITLPNVIRSPATPSQPVPAGRGHPEPGQHLVHDQQRAVSTGRATASISLNPGRGRDHAHVRRASLGDHARDRVPARRERLADRRARRCTAAPACRPPPRR